MTLLSNIKRLVFSVFIMTALSAQAFAQTNILVVDQQRVIRESEVGKHIARQIESIANTMQSEIKASTQPLEGERDRLVAELKNVDQAALRTRPDLQKRAQEFVAKGQKQQVEAQYKQRELQVTEQKALQKVNTELAEVLKAIVTERNADIVLDRSLVIFGGTTVDVTDTVVARLNSRIRTVSVVRERLPRQPAQAGPVR